MESQVYKSPSWPQRKKQLKNNRNQRTTKSIKNIKTIDLVSDPNFNYCSIEAGPTTKPMPKYCDITGYETKYEDTETKMHFFDKIIHSYIKLLSRPVVEQFLMLRGVYPPEKAM